MVVCVCMVVCTGYGVYEVYFGCRHSQSLSTQTVGGIVNVSM